MSDRRDKNLKELLGEARAIYFVMTCGKISYKEAKNRTKPLLLEINIAIETIAKKYKQRPKYVKFNDLGSRF